MTDTEELKARIDFLESHIRELHREIDTLAEEADCSEKARAFMDAILLPKFISHNDVPVDKASIRASEFWPFYYTVFCNDSTQYAKKGVPSFAVEGNPTN